MWVSQFLLELVYRPLLVVVFKGNRKDLFEVLFKGSQKENHPLGGSHIEKTDLCQHLEP